jgi:hypothetical protein
MLQMISALMGCTHESVRVNWLMAVSAIIEDCPHFVDLLHVEGVWQAVLEHFEDESCEVKRASVTFICALISVFEPDCEILAEMIGAGIFDFIREVVDIGDAAMVKDGLRMLCAIRDLLPEGARGVTLEVLESLVESDNETIAPYLDALLGLFGSALAAPLD